MKKDCYPLSVKIAGTGKYIPDKVVASDKIETDFDLPEGWCEKKLGIKERRWVEDKDETAAYMGAQAAKEAVSKAGKCLNDIDLIVYASNIFDQVIPRESSSIQKQLGLGDSGIMCMGIKSGCISFLKALDLSACMIDAERYQNILIISSHLSSFGYEHYDDPVMAAVVGDAAGAVVLTKADPTEKSKVQVARMETYAKAYDATGLSQDLVVDTMFSSNTNLRNKSVEMNDQIQSKGMEYNQKFLDKLCSFDREALDMVIPNQTNKLNLNFMKLSFSASEIKGIINCYGNIGAAGYPVALYEAIESQEIKRGDLVLLHGLAAGLSICGVVLVY